MTTNRSRELFPRLCTVGNALEDVRDTTLRQGALWLQLDAVLQKLDAVIDTLHEAPPEGGSARHAAREGEDEA